MCAEMKVVSSQAVSIVISASVLNVAYRQSHEFVDVVAIWVSPTVGSTAIQKRADVRM